jgi:hypothetical protein
VQSWILLVCVRSGTLTQRAVVNLVEMVCKYNNEDQNRNEMYLMATDSGRSFRSEESVRGSYMPRLGIRGHGSVVAPIVLAENRPIFK